MTAIVSTMAAGISQRQGEEERSFPRRDSAIADAIAIARCA
jgi:hypothetical protein